MQITVQRGNYDKYAAQSHQVMGVGKTLSGALLLELVGQYRKGSRYLVKINGRVVEHACRAVEHGTPCWHLAAALDVAAQIKSEELKLPARVSVTLREPQPEPVRDVTPDIFGRPGDFALLEELLPDEPAEPEDASSGRLLRYSLPKSILEKVHAFRKKQEETLTEEQRARIPEPKYVPVGMEVVRAVTALLYGDNGSQWEPVLLKGPRGTGKSTLADTLGAILMLPVVRITGGIDVNAEWLLGSRTLAYDEDDKQKVVHEPGLLLQAVQEGALLVVEEVNMLLPEVTSLLHSLLDWQRVLSVPGVGHVKPPESFRLVACMNVNYAGTRQLNEAFKDRFREIKVPYLPEHLLAQIIAERTGIQEEIAGEMAGIFHLLAGRVDNGDLTEEALSIRSLLRAAREIVEAKIPPKDALVSNLCEGIDDPYTASVVKEVVDSRIA